MFNCFILPLFLIIIAPSSTGLKKTGQLNGCLRTVKVEEKSSHKMTESQNNDSNKQNKGNNIKNLIKFNFTATLTIS